VNRQRRRVPAGRRDGGQFAGHPHAEPFIDINHSAATSCAEEIAVDAQETDGLFPMPAPKSAREPSRGRSLAGATEGLDEQGTTRRTRESLDHVRHPADDLTIQRLAVVAIAATIRDQHPYAASIDLIATPDGLSPIAVRDRFGDPLPTLERPDRPWETIIDLKAASRFVDDLRPEEAETLTGLHAAPADRPASFVLDVDEVLGTAPF